MQSCNGEATPGTLATYRGDRKVKGEPQRAERSNARAEAEKSVYTNKLVYGGGCGECGEGREVAARAQFAN
jgi:hypothetical protein